MPFGALQSKATPTKKPLPFGGGSAFMGSTSCLDTTKATGLPLGLEVNVNK